MSPAAAMSHETAGDPFEAHRIAMYRWAYRIVGRHHDALDVVQDVGMRWLLARDGVHAPTAWLRTATINRAIDVVRSRREASPPAGHADPADPADHAGGTSAGDPGARSAASELEALRRDVAGVLAALSEAQRAVLVAKVFDGLTFTRIAAEQGIAVPTAKTHYLRALRRAREALQPRWGAERETPTGASR